jgi:hypothetical protein
METEKSRKWYIVPRLLETIRLKRQRKLNEYDFFPLSGMFQQESIFFQEKCGKNRNTFFTYRTNREKCICLHFIVLLLLVTFDFI